MTYVTVQDLKRSAALWMRLREHRELIVMRDGRPCAILVDVNAETADDALREIRRARFGAAVSRIRRRAATVVDGEARAAEAIRESRARRR